MILYFFSSKKRANPCSRRLKPAKGVCCASIAARGLKPAATCFQVLSLLSMFNGLRSLWTPVFTGVTIFHEFINLAT